MQKLFHYYNILRPHNSQYVSCKVCSANGLQHTVCSYNCNQLGLPCWFQLAGMILVTTYIWYSITWRNLLQMLHSNSKTHAVWVIPYDQFLRQNSSLSSENFFSLGLKKDDGDVWEIIKGCNLYGNRLCRTTDIEEIEIPNKQKWKI